jgi:DNA-binding response OmpR family regulator
MPEMGGETVLVVEDDAVAAQAITAMLEAKSLEVEVMSVDRISRAEELLLDGSISCVFLDLGLPDSAGLEGMRRLIRTAPEIPIIVLTATDDELLASQAIQEGARDYVPKSAATAELLSRLLREVLSGPARSDG